MFVADADWKSTAPTRCVGQSSIICTATGDLHAVLILPRTKIENRVCYLSGDDETRWIAEPTEV